MKILLVSTCQEKLSEREFVYPISSIIADTEHEILHYNNCTSENISMYNKVIICGTALNDDKYLDNLQKFREMFCLFEGSILGICSGMQIVCSIFGGQIIDNCEIGMVTCKTLEPNNFCIGEFEAYSLHNMSVGRLKNFTCLATSESSVQIVKHNDRPVYGVSFHPEVRNQEIITNFLKL